MSISSKVTLLSGAVALALTIGTASIVQAGPKGPQGLKASQGLGKTIHPKHSSNHIRRHGLGWGQPIVVGSGYGRDCGYYMQKFTETGSYYWMGRYYECRY